MINDFISIIDDFYTKEQCEEFINFIEHYVNYGLITKENEKSHERNHFTMNFNNDEEFDLLSGDNLSIKFLPSISEPVNEYLKEYSTLGMEKLLIYDTKVKKIPIGGGFHAWHYENSGLQVSSRKLVIQLYLNTVEEGGETEFLYINKRVKSKQGRLIIFPAAFTHTHRGNPPIGQDKYIVSTWAKSQDNR